MQFVVTTSIPLGVEELLGKVILKLVSLFFLKYSASWNLHTAA